MGNWKISELLGREVVVTDGVADAKRVLEQRTRGIETLTRNLGNSAVELHLTVNLMTVRQKER